MSEANSAGESNMGNVLKGAAELAKSVPVYQYNLNVLREKPVKR